jgi:hypothetical protein
MTTRELLQRLLEAMEDPDISYEACLDLRIDVRAHLSAPEPEPVAWWDEKIGVMDEKHFDQMIPLYLKDQL